MRRVVICLVLFPWFLFALTPVSQGKDLVTKADATMDTLADTPIFKITVTNDTGDYVAVQGMDVSLPTDLFYTNFDNDIAFDLPNGQSREMEVRGLKPKRLAPFLRAKTYDAFVIVRYRIGGGATRNTPQAKATLSPLAPWWVVLIGAAVGVFTIVLFGFLLDFTKHPATPPSVPVGGGSAPGSGAATVLTHPWRQLLLGMVVVFMAVVLFRFTSAQLPDLPITVNVKDIYGGFALGLVFQPLVHFFSRLE